MKKLKQIFTDRNIIPTTFVDHKQITFTAQTMRNYLSEHTSITIEALRQIVHVLNENRTDIISICDIIDEN